MDFLLSSKIYQKINNTQQFGFVSLIFTRLSCLIHVLLCIVLSKLAVYVLKIFPYTTPGGVIVNKPVFFIQIKDTKLHFLGRSLAFQYNIKNNHSLLLVCAFTTLSSFFYSGVCVCVISVQFYLVIY